MSPQDDSHPIPFPVAKTYRDGTEIRDEYGFAPDPDELARARSFPGRLPEHLRDPIKLAEDAIEGRRKS